MAQNNVHSGRTTRKSILEYKDYRDFLADRWNLMKAENPRISFESASRKIGSSKSYLKMILDRRRHLSQNRLLKVASLFKLTEFETEYIFFLFLFGVTTEPMLKKHLVKILDRYTKDQETMGAAPPESRRSYLNTFDQWSRLLLYNMVRLKDFKFTKAWLKSRLCSDTEAEGISKQTMEELIQDHVVTLDSHGFSAKNYIHRQSSATEVDFPRRLTETFLKKSLEANEGKAGFKSGVTLGSLMPMADESYRNCLNQTMEFEKTMWALSSGDPAPEQVYLRLVYMVSLTK